MSAKGVAVVLVYFGVLAYWFRNHALAEDAAKLELGDATAAAGGGGGLPPSFANAERSSTVELES